MSIEMDNPKTIEEKLDVIGNLIAQMYLAHTVHDEATFKTAHKRAGDLVWEVIETIEEGKTDK